jgi:type IV secretory pathway VirB4 component
MSKTLRARRRAERERFRRTKGVHDAIPIQRVWEDGIFLTGKNVFAKTYRISDINYAVASREDKEALFLEYSELLNSFDTAATTKLTVALRRINAKDFEQRILIPYAGDRLDVYREEYNRMLMAKATGANSMVREMYLTVSVQRKNIEDARLYFRRTTTDIAGHLSRLGSKCVELDAADKLRALHDFYRTGEEERFLYDGTDSARRGHSFKDSIAPDSLEFNSDYFKVGNRYGRVLYLREFASYLKDSFVSELTELNRNLMLSIDVIPIPTDEAVREVEKRLLGVETNITNWTRKQNQNLNYNVVVPYDMEQQRKESREFLDDLVTRDQRMMFAVVTLVHTADTSEQLDSDTEAIKTTARKHLCSMTTCKFQQMDGLNTALPIGTRKIEALRTLTTESLAVLMPFRVQEIMDTGGIYFGENAISRNLIMCNKANLLNPNAFILGVPGSGKSFSTKELIAVLALSTQDDIIICDPEREYASLIVALGGEVIRIAAGRAHHINALDMVEGYGDGGNPVIDKSEFVLSLFEQLDSRGLNAQAKSIIDRCTAQVYADWQQGGALPTLIVLRDKLLQQPEPEARELALSLELFTSGTLDAFAHPTNVDTQNRMVVYDIMDLGKQLKTMGLLVITDAMLNRVTDNWRNGKRTHIFVDEFHVVFENEYSGSFFNSAWRRFRKRNAYPTAVTQNVEYLLDSVLASTMLSNSEFVVMLNQAASDREKLAKLLNISHEQMSYITNADAGCGLLRYGSSLVPFVNRWPKGKLYKLMTTRPLDSWQQ